MSSVDTLCQGYNHVYNAVAPAITRDKFFDELRKSEIPTDVPYAELALESIGRQLDQHELTDREVDFLSSLVLIEAKEEDEIGKVIRKALDLNDED